MTKTINARGLSCPAPVLMAKEAVQKDHLDALEVLVDNEAARENVSRFLGSQQFSVTAVPEGSDFKISARRQGYAPEAIPVPEFSCKAVTERTQKILVLIATDRLGFGDDELGRKLVISFIKTLKEMEDELWRLVLVNNGVKLTIADSPVLEDLMVYEKKGLTILVCGTCLTHFDLLEAKRVGVTTNMLDIVTAMQVADKVINI
ncbi:sulfurtransferase-like selenium metabolism protein YedF [Thermodesulfobacteriota bacterium]